MSTDYDLGCVTCGGKPSGLINATNQRNTIAQLAQRLPLLIALDDARIAFVEEPLDWRLDLNITFEALTGGYGGNATIEAIAKWAREHAGHTIRVIDEYGRFDTTCDSSYTCSGGHRHRCERNNDHPDGEHGARLQ